MIQLRLIDENGYTVTLPGVETVVTVADDRADETEALLRAEPAEAHAALWRQVARENAEELGGESTSNGRNALARVAQHDARNYRVTRTPIPAKG
ncbi:hypothetical protein ACIBUR_38665 [Streptomyces anulatus]